MAKADSSEIAILPIEITSAVTRLTHSMGSTGAMVEPDAVLPPNSASLYVWRKLLPGTSDSGWLEEICSAVWVEPISATTTGNITNSTPPSSSRWEKAVSAGRRSIMRLCAQRSQSLPSPAGRRVGDEGGG